MTNIGLLIPAAGYSRRFGAEHKLLSKIGDRTILEHTLEIFADFEFSQKILVTNPEIPGIADIGHDHHLNVVLNDNSQNGLGTSIATGIRYLENLDAVMIAHGDMPNVRPETIGELIKFFMQESEKSIVAPTYNNSRGHPVIFSSLFFDALSLLNGDHGARHIFTSNPAALRLLDTKDPGILLDIDTKQDLIRYAQDLNRDTL